MAENNENIASPPPAEETGIDAYHGSPHEFEQFDSSKIGTGEGAQSFGHGLYFAGAEPTAKSYRDVLSKNHVLTLNTSKGSIKGDDLDDIDLSIVKYLEAGKRDAGKFPHNTLYYAKKAAEKEGRFDVIDRLESYGPNVKFGYEKNLGHMYEVRINAHPDHLLDWDKPLSKQSDYVRKALEGFGIKISDEDWKNYDDALLNALNHGLPPDFELNEPHDPSGENIYKSRKIVGGTHRDNAAVSKALLDVGIKGIKYLDANSRGAKGDTRNYVVFDDKLINIKRRYEMGGAVPMASGGETGDTQNMPQGISPEQQSLLDQLSRAIDESVARYSDGHAGGSASPARGYQEPTMPGEPSLTRQQEQDYNINRLQDALNRVPAAAHGGAMGYAEGGDVENNPVVQKALSLTSGSEPRKVTINRGVPEAPPFSIQSFQAPNPTATTKGYSFSKLNEGEATTQKLADIVRRAIDRHISLPPNERVKNSMDAIKALEPYLGTRKDGSPISLLGKNAKLEKSSKGYKGGEPITLPDGRGIETTGISMLPAYQEGKFNLCPNSGSCKDQCLGKTAGNFYAIGGGRDLDALKGPRLRAFNRTVAFLREPEAFAIRAFDDIDLAKRQAAMYGNHLGVRMNVLSDIHPEVYRPIMENHPDVSFYDYTKMSYRRILPNHHLTYSSTGLTQSDVDNPWTNWNRMRRVLDRGDNVAMVFTNKQKVLPKYVHDSETGKRYDVIDGRTHDFRPLDLLEAKPGSSGVIVGLSNLKAFGEREKAHKDSKGFFVKYDPKTDGDSVKVMPQGKGMTGMTNDGKIEREP